MLRTDLECQTVSTKMWQIQLKSKSYCYDLTEQASLAQFFYMCLKLVFKLHLIIIYINNVIYIEIQILTFYRGI